MRDNLQAYCRQLMTVFIFLVFGNFVFAAGTALTTQSSLTVSVSYPDKVCYGSSAVISVSVSGGQAPYQYYWSTGETTSAIIQPAGTYTLIVADSDNPVNIYSAVITIQEAALLTASASAQAVSCYGGSDGSAAAAASGGVQPYNYSWTGGATPPVINGLPAGNYACIVTDSIGCSDTAEVMVAEPPAVKLHYEAFMVKCAGQADGEISVWGSDGSGGPYSFNWVHSGQTDSALSGLLAGTYTVSVTDKNGCAAIETILVDEPAPLEFALTDSYKTLCANQCNGSAAVVMSGGTPPFSYQWSSGHVTANANWLCAGTHTVIVTDDNGCLTATTVDVEEPDSFHVTVSVLHDADCGQANGIAAVSASGGTPGFSFWWYPYIYQYGDTMSNLPAGQFHIYAIDANGCTGTASVFIKDNPGVTASVDSIVSPLCWNSCDGGAHAVATGGTSPYVFQWSADPIQFSEYATGLCAGTYTVNISDANNCNSSVIFTVAAPPAVVVNASPGIELCHGQSAVLTANAYGGNSTSFKYLWNNGDTSAQITVSPLQTTIYSVIATGADGCSSSADSVLVQLGEPVIAFAETDHKICKGAPVILSGSAAGGSGSYTYTWLPGYETGQSVTLQPPASVTYTLAVDDGCMRDSVPVEVKVLPQPGISMDTAGFTGCAPFCTAMNCTFTICDDFSVTAVYWEFGDGTISNDYNPVHCYEQAGTYDIKITAESSAGCVAVKTMENFIHVNPAPEANFVCDQYFASENNGEISFFEQANGEDAYFWDFGDNTGFSDLSDPVHIYSQAGIYYATLLVRNEFKCIDTAIKVIDVRNEFTLYIPNAFTPDGNYFNETFRAYGNNVRDFRMWIYDRWGRLIYENENIEEGWDGKTPDNSKAEGGVYVYRMQATDPNGKKHHYTGHVVLVR